MPTKHQLKVINDAARHENRERSIDPNFIAALPDDGRSFRIVELLTGAGGWNFGFALPSGVAVLTVTDLERQQHGF
jgi:hypothetical protein